MGRARTERRQARPSDETSEQHVARQIALVLAGVVVLPSGVSLAAAIAVLLRLLPGAPDVNVTEAVARLVVQDQAKLPSRSEGTTAASRSNVAYRAHYAIEATKRIARDVAEGESLRDAIVAERPNLARHLEASRRRSAGVRLVEAAAELHGPVLGWVHGHPNEPRPTHEAADGQNFRADSVPTSTGAYPGVLPGCTCTVAPPFVNGRMLA